MISSVIETILLVLLLQSGRIC